MPTKKINLANYGLYLTVFVVNFCVVTIELTVGRIIAPYVGVSLYTWTTVIGVILLGMTMGNLAGGKIADKNPSNKTIGIILFGASLFTLMAITLVKVIAGMSSGSRMPYLVEVFMYTVFFFFPGMALSAVTPIIAKLTIANLKTTGRIIGKINATAALGSIAGTFATGYFLISWFGTRAIILGIALILLLASVGYLGLGASMKYLKNRQLQMVLLLIVLPIMLLLGGSQRCQKESNYYCLSTGPLQSNNNLRALMLDKLTHSITDINNPNHLEYDYEKFFAVMYDYANLENSQVLFLGGGGYTLPRYLVNRYQSPKVTVIEIDPEVTKIAREQMGAPDRQEVRTINTDARMYFRSLSENQKYQIIFGDAFSDYSIPYHLTTKEFTEMIRGHLENGGYYVANIIDKLDPGLFIKSYARTLLKVFPYVYLFSPGREQTNEKLRYTFVVVAGNQPLNQTIISLVSKNLGYKKEISQVYSDTNLEQLLASQKPPIVLTDDYVPVDNLMAGVFAGY